MVHICSYLEKKFRFSGHPDKNSDFKTMQHDANVCYMAIFLFKKLIVPRPLLKNSAVLRPSWIKIVVKLWSWSKIAVSEFIFEQDLFFYQYLREV